MMKKRMTAGMLATLMAAVLPVSACVQSSNALHGVFSIFVCMTLINKAMRVNEEDY